MSDPTFIRMREGLIERGLLCGDTLQLTAEGNEHVVSMMTGLRNAPEPAPPIGEPVEWDMRPDRPRKAMVHG